MFPDLDELFRDGDVLRFEAARSAGQSGPTYREEIEHFCDDYRAWFQNARAILPEDLRAEFAEQFFDEPQSPRIEAFIDACETFASKQESEVEIEPATIPVDLGRFSEFFAQQLAILERAGAVGDDDGTDL